MEAIWNHVPRYLGGGVVRQFNAFPVRANGDFYKIATEERRVFFRNLDQPKDNLLGVFMSRFLAPATLEGTVFLVHEPIDQVMETARRGSTTPASGRVRRAPDLSYDNINDGTRTAHDRPVRRVQRRTRPLRLEAGRQEGDVRRLQRLQAVGQGAQSTRKTWSARTR